MATTKKRTPAKTTRRRPSPSQARKTLDRSMKRVNQSIDAAEAAVKDLRSGAAKGSRDLVRDLEKTLRDARSNARRVSKAVSKDLKKAIRAETNSGRARSRRSPSKSSRSKARSKAK